MLFYRLIRLNKCLFRLVRLNFIRFVKGKYHYHCVYENLKDCKLSGDIMKCLLTDSATSEVDLALFIVLPNQMFYGLTLPLRQ